MMNLFGNDPPEAVSNLISVTEQTNKTLQEQVDTIARLEREILNTKDDARHTISLLTKRRLVRDVKIAITCLAIGIYVGYTLIHSGWIDAPKAYTAVAKPFASAIGAQVKACNAEDTSSEAVTICSVMTDRLTGSRAIAYGAINNGH